MESKPILAYKLLRQMKSGALRSLFIDKRTDRPVGMWMQAAYFPTPKFAPRYGWHCTLAPVAPHLTQKGRECRVWAEVLLDGEVEYFDRPASQGGRWILGKERMKILRVLDDREVALLSRQKLETPEPPADTRGFPER